MKRLLIMLALTAPAIGLIGCQDNSELENQIADLRSEVKGLKSQSDLSDDTDGNKGSVNYTDLSSKELAIRLESTQEMLKKAEDRITALESRPDSGDTVSNKSNSTDEGVDTVASEFDTKIADAMKRINDQKKAERDAKRAERMAEISKIAEENGIEFDKDNPRKSMMDIMANPEKRKKAFEVMRGEMNKRRLEPMNLSEKQTEDVLRIEKDFRDRTKETISSARERGATPEQIEADIKYLQEDKDREMQGVLDQEQYDEYKDSAENGSQMPDNMEDITKMIPPGMIPGMGGGMPGGDQ